MILPCRQKNAASVAAAFTLLFSTVPGPGLTSPGRDIRRCAPRWFVSRQCLQGGERDEERTLTPLPDSAQPSPTQPGPAWPGPARPCHT